MNEEYIARINHMENSCWHLITLLWRLDIIHYESCPDDDFDYVRYSHQREIVSRWSWYYRERKKI